MYKNANASLKKLSDLYKRAVAELDSLGLTLALVMFIVLILVSSVLLSGKALNKTKVAYKK